MDAVAALTKLVTLNLQNNSLTEIGGTYVHTCHPFVCIQPVLLYVYMPPCTILHLVMVVKLTSFYMLGLSSLPNLQWLCLSGNSIKVYTAGHRKVYTHDM